MNNKDQEQRGYQPKDGYKPSKGNSQPTRAPKGGSEVKPPKKNS